MGVRKIRVFETGFSGIELVCVEERENGGDERVGEDWPVSVNPIKSSEVY